MPYIHITCTFILIVNRFSLIPERPDSSHPTNSDPPGEWFGCPLLPNPSQLASLFFIQLSKNASGNFTTVVSVASGNKLLWADSTLYNRGAIASGSISTKSTPQLRFTIQKDIVRCPDDFKLYKCKMSGFDLQSNAFESETMPITVTYNSMYCI